MPEAALGLGSNLGDRAASLRSAVRALAGTRGIAITAVSSVWKSAPWGMQQQPDFLNACILVQTDLPPELLLAECLRIETLSGRERNIRWGPRTLDIDILFYDNLQIGTSTLTLPHPRMLERSFVLAPLEEIAPDHVVSGYTVADHLRGLPLAGLERIGPLPD